jgi:hypothetical protein
VFINWKLKHSDEVISPPTPVAMITNDLKNKNENDDD